MRLRRWRLAGVLAACALVLAMVAATAGPAGAAPKASCSGDLTSFPANVGVLAGTYDGNVVVSGACVVVAGPTVVNGDLTLAPGATLIAAFSTGSLTVNGNVLVQKGATLILGCLPTSFPCFDDMGEVPSLSSPGSVSGNLIATQPLGVIVHNTTIQGHVSENGGGGGTTCEPAGGIFALLGFPAYSDYEDSSIGGNLNVNHLHSCWLGMARDQVGGNLLLNQDQLADPDGAEVISNAVSGNLVCHQNSMVWDSADLSESGLYPRAWEPNSVDGGRVGQCVVAPPIDSPGGVSPGAF